MIHLQHKQTCPACNTIYDGDYWSLTGIEKKKSFCNKCVNTYLRLRNLDYNFEFLKSSQKNRLIREANKFSKSDTFSQKKILNNV